MKLINNRNFLSLATGSFISTLGDHLYNFALTIWLYETTKSVSAVAIMWFARAFLRIPVQYLSGTIVDKYNKKYIAMLTNAISIPLAFSLIFIDHKNLYLVYTVVFLLQAINDIDVTAEVALLPEIVEKDKLQEYNSVFSMLGTVALLTSPALGGLIYQLVGVELLFIINALSFLIATLSFAFIHYTFIENKNKNNTSSLIASGLEGFNVIKKNPIFILLILSVMSLSILGRFYEIYKVYIADEILNIGADGILYFSYAMAFGGFLTPIIIKNAKTKFQDDLIKPFILFASLTSICYFIWGNAQNVFISLITLFLLGAISSCYLTMMTTIIQKNTPQELVGRVFAAYKIALISSAILGIVISPFILNVIGLFGSFAIFCLIPILIGIMIIYLQKETIKVKNMNEC